MAAIKSFNRGVRKMLIAKWNGVASYGTAYQVLGVRQANLSWPVSADKARGDDADLDAFATIPSCQLSIAHASLDLIPANMILGGTLISNSTYYDLVVGDGNDPPYFAIAYEVYGSGGAGNAHVFIPKAKITGSPSWNAQVDTYLFPSLQFEGVQEGTVNGVTRIRHFTALPSALTIPLATT